MSEVDFQPFIEWLKLNPNWVLFSVLAISFIESLALAGVIVPGVLLLFLVAAVAGHLEISLWLILSAGFLGAILGDGISFYLGHYFKDSLRQAWPFSRYPKSLTLGEDFFLKHGGKSIMLGRFIGPIRPVLPLVAGMLDMSQLRFTLFNVLSAVLWAPVYILPGYLTGSAAHLILPEHFYTVIISCLLGLTAIALVFRFLSLNLQQNSPIYDALALKREDSAFFDFFFRAFSFHHIKTHQTQVSHPQDKRDPAALLEFPLASLSLFVISFSLFIIWSLFTLETNALQPLNDFLLSFAADIRNQNSGINELVTQTAVHLTLLGDEGFLYISFSILIGFMLYRKQYYAALFLAIGGLSTAAITHSLKSILMVSRPEFVLIPPESFAYPSGHSSGATVLYGLIASFIAQELQHHQRWKCYLLFSSPIFLIAISRVMLGVHWFTDIVGGIALGLAICGLTRVTYSRFISRDIARAQTCQTDKAKKLVILVSAITIWLIACVGYQYVCFEAAILNFKVSA
jgi:undecaprenyl-diphosphatase